MNTTETTKKIELKQKPIISHDLKKIGEEVTKTIEDLNLNNIVASEDNRLHLKNLRSTLNGQYSKFEAERKGIKNGVLTPYKAFEDEYKVEISEKYKNADKVLKTAIDSVEDGIKANKKASIEAYFNELCKTNNIDFLKLDDVGLNITLSVTDKKLKEQTTKFVDRISGDVQIIESMEKVPEMLAEYKQCLDAGKAINTVRERFRIIEEEKRRKKIQENNRRIAKLTSLGFFLDEGLKAYVYDDEIYITSEEVESIEKDDFEKKHIELEEAIKVKRSKPVEPVPAPEQKPVEANEDNGQKQNNEHVAEQKPVVPEPLKKPEAKKILKAKFEVEGTLSELKALGAWLKANNYTYKNI